MEKNVKNNADAIIFHIDICFGAKTNVLMADEKTPAQIFIAVSQQGAQKWRLVC